MPILLQQGIVTSYQLAIKEANIRSRYPVLLNYVSNGMRRRLPLNVFLVTRGAVVDCRL